MLSLSKLEEKFIFSSFLWITLHCRNAAPPILLMHMATRRFLSNRKLLLLVAATLFFCGVVFFSLPRTHANSVLGPNYTLIQNQGLLLNSSFDGNSATVESVKLSANALQVVSDFGNGATQNDLKELFLSPDRKLIAITLAPIGEEVWPSTYISSVDGTRVTSVYPGRFESWAPDSSKVLLYVSTAEQPWERKIYALDAQNKYYDSGLPNGTISADISPIDGSILYSFTSGGSDNSTLYIRNPKENDQLLLKGTGNVYAWVRWSPKGDKIAFMKADLFADSGEVWTMNSDGTGPEKASDVVWNYPAVWSPDGTKLAFADAGNIWEYDAVGKSLKKVTKFSQGEVQHPSYSVDGKTIVFSSAGSGESQIWTADNGVVVPLTNANDQKDYPILP
jgi:WD40 repeat protein